MSLNTVLLRRKIDSARNLQSVVRTMKAMAATNISQYERSVLALADYYRTVERGLSVCLQATNTTPDIAQDTQQTKTGSIHAVVFGSDQGLVGRFNDVVVDYALERLASLTVKPEIWTVGERVHARLAATEISLPGLFTVPNSVKAISLLVGQILIESEERRSQDKIAELHLFYNQPTTEAIYRPVSQRLLPLDAEWQEKLADIPWPTKNPPEIIGNGTATLEALVREYLFVSLFRACAESLASENASRLAAMQRAEKNIDDLLADLGGTYNRLRQSNIDEELSDVIAGFEALCSEGR